MSAVSGVGTVTVTVVPFGFTMVPLVIMPSRITASVTVVLASVELVMVEPVPSTAVPFKVEFVTTAFVRVLLATFEPSLTVLPLNVEVATVDEVTVEVATVLPLTSAKVIVDEAMAEFVEVAFVSDDNSTVPPVIVEVAMVE